MRMVFDQQGDFQALRACEHFLRDAGFSFGSWQRGAPCGAMYGDFDISKWRNMTAAERSALHASFSGDGRDGPITLVFHPTCPAEAMARVQADERERANV